MPIAVKHAIIGGSRAFETVQRLLGSEATGPLGTPFGPCPPIHRMEIAGRQVAFVSRHGERGYTVSAPFVNYRAIIWALKELGVERIVGWSGPGAIDGAIPIGDILIPADLIDETTARPFTFFDGQGIGFVRQNPVFCPELAKSLRRVIEARIGHCRTDDVYVCTQGPRLETPAEIRKFASYGGTLVGMTLVPEVFLARELEMCYCPVCYVTNYAEGVVDRPFEPAKLFGGLASEEELARVQSAAEMLPEIAAEALIAADSMTGCNCRRTMERYRKRGDIGEDWHTWIGKGSVE